MQKQIQVIKCETIKTGETNGKQWTIYKVYCNGDDDMKEFTTFNADFVNADGQQMQVNVMYDEKYKTWKETSARQEAEQGKHEEILDAIRKVWARVDELGQKLDK